VKTLLLKGREENEIWKNFKGMTEEKGGKLREYNGG
jgi:hypothetical protein